MRRFEQRPQTITLARWQGGVEQQFAGAELVVADQRPAVQAETRIRQAQVVSAVTGQVLQTATEVIGQVADQTADEWCGVTLCKFCRAEALQGAAQPLQEIVGRFVGTRRQFCQWPGAHKVIASTLGTRASGIQQDGPRRLANTLEVSCRVGVIGQRMQGAAGHAWSSGGLGGTIVVCR